MSPWKFPFYSAVFITLVWLLSPTRSEKLADSDVVEINAVLGSGPVADALGDVVREFESESRRAHEKDPSQPIYQVITGQTAMRDQTADPTRFLISVAGGMPPDVIYFDRFAVTEWAARGAFYPLDEFLEHDRQKGTPDAIRSEDYYPAAWNETIFTQPLTGETHVYGIPNNFNDRGLYYNKDLLIRAGYVDAKGNARPPATWEELEEMALALTERNADGRVTRLGYAPNYGNVTLYMYGWMNGGEFMSNDGRTVTLNDPRIVSALEWMSRLYSRLGGPSQVMAFQAGFQGNELDPFLTGKIAMKIDGFWTIGGTLAQFGQNLNWGIAPPPLPAAEVARGKKPVTWTGGFCYAIPSTAKNKDAAWKLIRFLVSRRATEIYNESLRLTMESQGRVFVPMQDPNRAVNAWLFDHYVFSNPSVDAQIKDGVKVMNDLLDTARYRPVTPVGQLLWTEHITASDSAVFGRSTPQAALDEATANVQRNLDRILSPPPGTPVNWAWFFVAYAIIIILGIGLIYYFDARKQQEALSRSQWFGGLICASPWILGFVVFTGGPMLFSVLISFCEYDGLNPARIIGSENYVWMVTRDSLFWKSLGNTLYMVIGIPLGLMLSLAIALLLNMQVKGVVLWRTFFYLPSIVPAVASSILWIWIFNPHAGLLNCLLGSFGLEGPNWLQDEKTSKLSLILMGLWGAGGGMIIWIAGLKAISESYYEAAILDGANAWQKFRFITVPMLSPYIFFNLIMGLIGTFQIFTQAFIMTQGGPVNSTLFYAYHLFNHSFRYLNMGYAAAMAWFLFVIVLGLTIVQMKLSERWVHYESE